ncbi:MAG: gfo/Idh/MocA family oxidoreductase, partial [Nitratireductor sp.]
APFNTPDYGDTRVTMFSADHNSASVHRFPRARQYRLQAEAIVAAARGERTPIFTLEDSMKNQKLIDAIYRAAGHDGWEVV